MPVGAFPFCVGLMPDAFAVAIRRGRLSTHLHKEALAHFSPSAKCLYFLPPLPAGAGLPAGAPAFFTFDGVAVLDILPVLDISSCLQK
jgi:hypothetical protein